MKSGSAEVSGYCMKCKTTREMKNVENVVMKNGKPAKRGVCSVCGTKMFKIGGGSLVKGAAYKKSKKAVSKRSTKKKSKKSKKAVSKKSKKTASKKRKTTKKKKASTLDLLAGW